AAEGRPAGFPQLGAGALARPIPGEPGDVVVEGDVLEGLREELRAEPARLVESEQELGDLGEEGVAGAALGEVRYDLDGGVGLLGAGRAVVALAQHEDAAVEEVVGARVLRSDPGLEDRFAHRLLL